MTQILTKIRAVSAVLALAVATGGCSAIRQQISAPALNIYTLDGAAASTPSMRRSASGGVVLSVAVPEAGPGFDTRRMAYTRGAGELEHFAYNEWADTPPHMLEPMIVATLDSTGAFGAVVGMPTTAAADVLLHTAIVRLQQDFSSTPSHVRFTLRAYITQRGDGRVLATQTFDATAVAPSDDPKGGVAAARIVVHDVLTQLARFCVQAVQGITPEQATLRSRNSGREAGGR